MIKSLYDFFAQAHTTGNDQPVPQATQQQLRIASTALLFEMLNADFNDSPTERDAIRQRISQHFTLEEPALTQLLTQAESAAQRATSLYTFTQLINDHYDMTEKCTLIGLLWDIAIADGDIDKYEDHLVRKVSELLYVPHSDLMRLKHLALNA